MRVIMYVYSINYTKIVAGNVKRRKYIHIYMYSERPFTDLLRDKTNKELIFIHTPKCGGTYVSTILSYLKIKNNNHKQASANNGISFTCIRNPIDRFESLLNYRLNEAKPRNDWPKHLSYVYKNKNVKMNEIVSKMTDKEILGFKPYRTISYWVKNVDIIITLANLHKMLEYFGYTYNVNEFKPLNVSKKLRGKLNQKNRDRIERLFKNDMIIYIKVLNSMF